MPRSRKNRPRNRLPHVARVTDDTTETGSGNSRLGASGNAPRLIHSSADGLASTSYSITDVGSAGASTVATSRTSSLDSHDANSSVIRGPIPFGIGRHGSLLDPQGRDYSGSDRLSTQIPVTRAPTVPINNTPTQIWCNRRQRGLRHSRIPVTTTNGTAHATVIEKMR